MIQTGRPPIPISSVSYDNILINPVFIYSSRFLKVFIESGSISFYHIIIIRHKLRQILTTFVK